MKGWEEKQRGRGWVENGEEKRRGEKRRRGEKSIEEERREDYFSTMRTVQNEKFGELATSRCWHLVPYC